MAVPVKVEPCGPAIPTILGCGAQSERDEAVVQQAVLRVHRTLFLQLQLQSDQCPSTDEWDIHIVECYP